MTEYPDDFTDYPETITARKAHAKGEASIWTPRDALIDVLRDVDAEAGKEIDAVVICFRYKHTDGSTVTRFATASPDVHVAMGLLASTAQLIMDK